MTDFLWTSGHLGWGLFATLAFSGVWMLLVDLVWRLTRTAVRPFVVAVCGGWLAGLAVIVVIYATTRV